MGMPPQDDKKEDARWWTKGAIGGEVDADDDRWLNVRCSRLDHARRCGLRRSGMNRRDQSKQEREDGEDQPCRTIPQT